MKKLIYGVLFSGAILVTAPKYAHAAGTCGTEDYPCQHQSYTVNGVLYCRSYNDAPCTVNAGGDVWVTTGIVYLSECENGRGAGGKDICRLPNSALCTKGYIFSDIYECCLPNPDNSTFTTKGNCDWGCNQGYYKNGNECIRCPSSSVSGIYLNILDGKLNTNATRPGTTEEIGATSITDCYLPSGEDGPYYYQDDETGRSKSKGPCEYK